MSIAGVIVTCVYALHMAAIRRRHLQVKCCKCFSIDTGESESPRIAQAPTQNQQVVPVGRQSVISSIIRNSVPTFHK